MRKFPGCQFGPMQVRAVLRADRERGERLIGWGQAHVTLDVATGLFVTGLLFFPGIGHALHAVLLSQRTRFVVLTDRRVLLLVAGKKIKKFRREDLVSVPIDAIDVRSKQPLGLIAGRAAAFSLTARSLQRPIEITLNPNKKSKPLQRLSDGLKILARESTI